MFNDNFQNTAASWPLPSEWDGNRINNTAFECIHFGHVFNQWHMPGELVQSVECSDLHNTKSSLSSFCFLYAGKSHPYYFGANLSQKCWLASIISLRSWVISWFAWWWIARCHLSPIPIPAHDPMLPSTIASILFSSWRRYSLALEVNLAAWIWNWSNRFMIQVCCRMHSMPNRPTIFLWHLGSWPGI